MLYVTSLASAPSLRSLTESAAAKRVALIQSSSYYNPAPNDGVVLLLESDYLKLVGQFTLPDFAAGPNSFKAHGKWVFFNSASTALYVVMQADASAGLLNDFAVQTIPLSAPFLCGATFASASATSIATGSLGTVNIVVGRDVNIRR